MHIDPLVDAHRHQDRVARNDELYWKAFGGLHSEFLAVLADSPAESLSCPHEKEAPLTQVVEELVLAMERDAHTLADLLRVTHGAAAGGDARAQGLLQHLANTYAGYYAASMQDAGDFE